MIDVNYYEDNGGWIYTYFQWKYFILFFLFSVEEDLFFVRE